MPPPGTTTSSTAGGAVTGDAVTATGKIVWVDAPGGSGPVVPTTGQLWPRGNP